MDELFDCFSSDSVTPSKKRPHGEEVEEINDEEPVLKKSRPDAAIRDEPVSRGTPTVVEIDTDPGCTHEVALPPGVMYTPLIDVARKPAKEYKFVLDPFQREAVKCVENNQSVLVSAHTSAGKTVVAEYAVAVSLRDHQRVIYTTPIKALSNQKYRELYEDVQDVGLMTGDVTINPSASVLVMTTEILRSMLYRGSEVMREVGWVIFDEIHYMRDAERGVVWEETLILLPDNVHYVFLSATIPNARQFAQWIVHLHKQPCHVVYTDYRPTPLQHYIFPAGSDGLYLVVNERNEFLEDNFAKAMGFIKDAGSSGGGMSGGRGGGGGGASINRLIQMIMERSFQPVIIFSFSKKECETYALQLSKLDFTTEDEKKLISEVFNNAMDTLSDEDRAIPQVDNLLPLLRRGIGIHHGGLLPILKETIEILFGEGLLKALFATETFALGLNMPARTVVFTAIRKFDGRDFRYVTGGEYIQMSGRAGRRGLDDRGIVMMMVDERMEPEVGKSLLKGSSDPLNSAFRLTYNMVLNLLRVEEINPEYILERSFYQFQNSTAIPGMEDELAAVRKQVSAMVVPEEQGIMSFYNLRQQLDRATTEIHEIVTQPQNILTFLQPGRMVKVKHDEDDFGWGAVVTFQKDVAKTKGSEEVQGSVYVVDVLLHCATESTQNAGTMLPKPCPKGDAGQLVVVPILLSLIQEISTVRVYLPRDIRQQLMRTNVLKSIQDVLEQFPKGLPLLDPADDMQIKDNSFQHLIKKYDTLKDRIRSHPLRKHKDLDTLYAKCKDKMDVLERVKSLQKEIKRAQTILQMGELKNMKRVLRRLGYASASDVIEVKGRVACEISSCDELVLTELLFNGAFSELSAEQVTALLSCFVYDERSKETKEPHPDLQAPAKLLKDTARHIARIKKECKIDVDEDEYVQGFKMAMMPVVFAWCQGAQFLQVCKMTEAFEGSIIRCFRRLEEVLRQVAQAAKVVGNQALEEKFLLGIKLLKRDIAFAASLYL
eukprot:scpid29947/ scgid18789/ Superkiller viralicidic activity 2-like 2; ATP-dependent helicase SKIV2L2